VVRYLIPSLILVLLLVFLHSCYYLRQGSALFQIYGSAQKIDEVMKNPQLDSETREFLTLVQDIRNFGTRLGLKQNQNYTTYAVIGRDYLAAVVSASKPLAFEPYQWWHPIVGFVPYQGYFDLEEALQEARSLKNQGWDVWVRSVRAFSTLGWFSDPLFHFMKKYSEGELADLLLHEQTHATLWLPNYVSFNEAVAVVVGRKGALTYLEEKYGAEGRPYIEYQQRLKTNQEFLKLFLDLKQQLQELYSSPLEVEIKLQKKETIIKTFQENLPPELSGWKDRPINNAVLMTFSTYEDGVDKLTQYFENCGGLSSFLKNLSQIDSRSDPWKWLDEELARIQNR